jgi:hypothetical protein
LESHGAFGKDKGTFLNSPFKYQAAGMEESASIPAAIEEGGAIQLG